jgi:hypothetical protein
MAMYVNGIYMLQIEVLGCRWQQNLISLLPGLLTRLFRLCSLSSKHKGQKGQKGNQKVWISGFA